MSDPYLILGIDRNASDEDVKKAYRELAKRYHPDNYSETESAEFASEKMKDINQAYDQIMSERKSRQGYYGNFKRNGYGEFSNVRTLISTGQLDNAETILNEVPMTQRNAEWHFLKATIFYKRGWLQEAYTNFARAYTMDSQNPEYKAAFQEMQRQRSGNFGGYNPVTGVPCGCSCCDICSSLICADCCCECMGGDFIRCC